MEKEKFKKTVISQLPVTFREIDGEFYTEGWIYTTHMDRAQEDGAENSMFSKHCMNQIAEAINVGGSPLNMAGARRAVSKEHDWIREQDPNIEPIGMAVPPAEVRETDDGHFGVWCKTHYDKHHPDFEKTKSRIENGYYPGHSIEFNEGEFELVNVKGKVVKFIKSLKEFLGYGVAGARLIANPKAIFESFGYRMVEEALGNKEETQMADEETQKEEAVEQPVEESPKEEAPVGEEPKPEEPVKEEEEAEAEDEEEEESTRTVKKDKIETEDIVAQIRKSDEYKKALDDIKVSSRVAKPKEDTKMENIHYRTMKEALDKQEYAKFRNIAKDYASETELVRKAFEDPQSYTERGLMKNSTLRTRAMGKGLQVIGDIQLRGTLDTTGNPEATYGQQGAEFSDVYMPGLVDTFNNQRNYFGFLEKEDHVDGGEYVGWILITSQNNASNTVHVDFDDVNVTKSFADKEKIRSPLKVASVGISVADTTLRYSSRNLGDLFQRELEIGMNYLMNDVDTRLFAEVQDGAGVNPLGLEAVADSAGNTTIYGKVRSTANRLSPATASDTYLSLGGAITETALRNGLTKVSDAGVNLGRLAIVTSNKGKNYLFNLLDGNRRFATTQAEFGFNQLSVASYDGIPIITDHNANSTAATSASSSACLYFIDRDSAKIVMGMEPRIINLAKVGRATEAYLEMDYAHIYKEPRKIYMLDNFSTG